MAVAFSSNLTNSIVEKLSEHVAALMEQVAALSVLQLTSTQREVYSMCCETNVLQWEWVTTINIKLLANQP